MRLRAFATWLPSRCSSTARAWASGACCAPSGRAACPPPPPLERLSELAAAVRAGVADGLLDVCCHGYRWEDAGMREEEEKSRIAQAVASLTASLGAWLVLP
mmetsp:Transcript_44814/g.148537  ORF Transcript_44814/g.148537 Transcript_44814/m.148537 type:complete len:102 (+) Transcript_44814:480-785(+)